MRADEWISWNHIKARSGVNLPKWYKNPMPSTLVMGQCWEMLENKI